jgi:hypothetical protein
MRKGRANMTFSDVTFSLLKVKHWTTSGATYCKPLVALNALW